MVSINGVEQPSYGSVAHQLYKLFDKADPKTLDEAIKLTRGKRDNSGFPFNQNNVRTEYGRWCKTNGHPTNRTAPTPD